MEVKHYVTLSSRGTGLDDVCGRMASLRLFEFCLCGYPKALVRTWCAVGWYCSTQAHCRNMSLDSAYLSLCSWRLQLRVSMGYRNGCWTLIHHVSTAIKHDAPMFTCWRDVLRCTVCNGQIAALLRQFLWHLCAAFTRIWQCQAQCKVIFMNIRLTAL